MVFVCRFRWSARALFESLRGDWSGLIFVFLGSGGVGFPARSSNVNSSTCAMACGVVVLVPALNALGWVSLFVLHLRR